MIATELGVVLRMVDRHGQHGHRAFSELVFGRDSLGAEVINEGCDDGGVVGHEEDQSSRLHGGGGHEPVSGPGYLEDDDIEDW